MVQVIIKAFDILELIAKSNGQSVSLTEVAKKLGMSQPTAANIINTMVSRGYVEHIGKKKGYKLGPSSYRLTNEVAYEKELVEVSKKIMEDLTLKLNETSLLGVLRNQKRLTLHVANSTHDIQVQVKSERSVYETASGRLLLAYLKENEIVQFVQQNGLPDATLWPGASTNEGLNAALSRIKEEAIAATFLPEKHVKGFAVPISKNNKVIAALSIFLPAYRCNETKQLQVIQLLKEASSEIEQKLKEV
jgi:DNA-binding IclR family transcriptional regulator